MIIARYFGWLVAAWPVPDTHMTSRPFRSPCAVPEPLKPPVGIRPRLSTVVWAMVMGENEEVGCLWFVECKLWFVVCGLWLIYLLLIYLFWGLWLWL